MKFNSPRHDIPLWRLSLQGLAGLAALMSPSVVLAEDIPDMNTDYFVVTENDSTQVMFPVLDKPVITLNDLAVNINSDSKTYSAEIANILDFRFMGKSINGVTSIAGINKGIEYSNNSIIIKGLSKGETVSLFDMKGVVISSYKSKEDNLVIDLNRIPAGVYILSTKNANYKIRK